VRAVPRSFRRLGFYNAVFASLAVCAIFCLASPEARAESNAVAWRAEWPRVRPSEIALTAGLAFNVGEAAFLYPAPKNNWEGGILFDNALRDAIVLNKRAAREATAEISDDIYYALAGYPLVVDTAIITAGFHGAGDVAFQMMLINFESYALTGAVALAAEKLGRARPMTAECRKDPNYDGKCADPGQLNASFLSGHTTIAFAGAGLICAHHTHLPLYGSSVADGLACISAAVAATGAGVLRVMSDNHYASDVILGAGVGVFGGYIWPMLWHYGFTEKAPRRAGFLPQMQIGRGAFAFSAALVPQIGPSGMGLTFSVVPSQ
jgi:membrane-associated phospholipid phosphatase